MGLRGGYATSGAFTTARRQAPAAWSTFPAASPRAVVLNGAIGGLGRPRSAERRKDRPHPGIRPILWPLPIPPAFSVAASACPGRHREGRTHLGRPLARARLRGWPSG